MISRAARLAAGAAALLGAGCVGWGLRELPPLLWIWVGAVFLVGSVMIAVLGSARSQTQRPQDARSDRSPLNPPPLDAVAAAQVHAKQTARAQLQREVLSAARRSDGGAEHVALRAKLQQVDEELVALHDKIRRTP